MTEGAVSTEDVSESNNTSMWKRPDILPFPMVWHRFVGRSQNRRLPMKIQDIPPDRFDEVLDFMASEFDTKEPISACPISAEILKRENVQVALRRYRRKILEQRVSLLAVLENQDPKPEIVGCALLIVNQENQPFPLDEIEEYDQVMEIVRHVRRGVKIKQLFSQKPYAEDSGICVTSKFLGMGTSYRLLIALENMASTLGIAGAAMTFSSKYSQRSAAKANFKFLKQLKYEDFKDENDPDEVVLPQRDQFGVWCLSTEGVTEIFKGLPLDSFVKCFHPGAGLTMTGILGVGGEVWKRDVLLLLCRINSNSYCTLIDWPSE